MYLDDELLGEAPVTREDIPAGRHRVRVESVGHTPFEADVRVRGGKRAEVEATLGLLSTSLRVESGHRDIRVSFKNVSLSESISVVHKHRMGSCEGSLFADNQGLRYQTANKSDAFSAPFASLEQFEIDYIEKNLKVKVRKGKNYNFTEKSGNADPLFVFHKNVQAFREKMWMIRPCRAYFAPRRLLDIQHPSGSRSSTHWHGGATVGSGFPHRLLRRSAPLGSRPRMCLRTRRAVATARLASESGIGPHPG